VELLHREIPSFTLRMLRRQGTGRYFLICVTIAHAWHALSRTASVWFIPFLAPQRNWEGITVLSIYLKHAAASDKELLVSLQQSDLTSWHSKVVSSWSLFCLLSGRVNSAG